MPPGSRISWLDSRLFQLRLYLLFTALIARNSSAGEVKKSMAIFQQACRMLPRHR
jgi:hypothetical protein